MRHLRWSQLAFAALIACHGSDTAQRDARPEDAASGDRPADAAALDAATPQDRTAFCGSYQRQRNSQAVAAKLRDPGPAVALPGSTEPELSAGPILGAISDAGLKIWVRSDSDAEWSVRIWRTDGKALLPEYPGAPLTAAEDYTGSVEIRDLSPGRKYGYAVLIRRPGSAEPGREVAAGEFHTLAADHEPTRTRVVVGADITGSGPQPIFTQIHDVAPDFLLLVGDQMYADESEPTREGYSGYYRRNWNIKHLRALLKDVPAFMIWDDHEISDNFWPGKNERYQPAREAYDLYVQSHNPAAFRAGDLYYTLRSGDVSFFVLDVRSHRSPNTAIDDASKSMLGTAQKHDLLAWLRCEPAKLKVIVSPVIWSDWSMTGQDAWISFLTEREEILGYIAKNEIGDVMILSGDQHWSAVFRYERAGYRFYEFLPTPLSKGRATAPRIDTDEILARDDDNFVFGVVDIDTSVEPYTVDLTLCAADKPCQPGAEPEPGTSLDPEGSAENVPFTIHLTARDLGLPKE
ncbi:MAG TPA: alkaline phosphatase D family protein [Polyangiales bacterium]|nr:alkaline phosphatase D family protein [Polyangiales bacterium]